MNIWGENYFPLLHYLPILPYRLLLKQFFFCSVEYWGPNNLLRFHKAPNQITESICQQPISERPTDQSNNQSDTTRNHCLYDHRSPFDKQPNKKKEANYINIPSIYTNKRVHQSTGHQDMPAAFPSSSSCWAAKPLKTCSRDVWLRAYSLTHSDSRWLY